jgi:hypothetical protein
MAGGAVTKIDLGTCGNVLAQDINEHGIVVGVCNGDGFLWRK